MNSCIERSVLLVELGGHRSFITFPSKLMQRWPCC